MVYTKGDIIMIRLASGKEFKATALTSQEKPWDPFKVRIDPVGTVAEIDPVDVDLKLLHRSRSEENSIEEEEDMNAVNTVRENGNESVVANAAPRRKNRIVITRETIEAFSRWIDVQLPDGSRIQAQFRMLPSGTAGIMRIRMPFATINVMIYRSIVDEEDLYIPPVKNTYKTKSEDREAIVIDADEGQIDLLKAIAVSVMGELGLSFKPAARANSPTRGGGTHPVGSKAVSSGRRFSR